jgi:hypothetical protein
MKGSLVVSPSWWMAVIGLPWSIAADTTPPVLSTPPSAPVAAGPRLEATFQTFTPGVGVPQGSAADSGPRRPRAIEHSDFYYARLTVHRIASYAVIPAFVAEFVLGQSLYNNPPGTSGTRTAHSAAAIGVVSLFGLNTITGVWNLWDSRHDSTGRARRYIHAALMLASDAGFVAAEASAPGRRRAVRDPGSRARHRTIALTSMGVALTGYGMMLIWK